jgi:uncharacterized protein (TIGR02117 family)
MRWKAARLLSAAGLLIAVAIAPGCTVAPAIAPDPASAEAGPQRTIYVVRHGWHTGIVVRAADVPESAWPARRDFAGADYLEVGWGDREYYQAPDPDAWLALRALFWPTPGVLHVVGFSRPVERHFATAEIIELHVSEQGFARLVQYIRASHELDASGEPISLGIGRYGTSRFYASREAFHLFKTCNVWTARVLREGGVSLSSVPALTADGLITQLRPHGRMTSPAP